MRWAHRSRKSRRRYGFKKFQRFRKASNQLWGCLIAAYTSPPQIREAQKVPQTQDTRQHSSMRCARRTGSYRG